jgi:hypothetical protein
MLTAKALALLTLFGGLATAVQASAPCNARANESKAYLRATDAVRRLSEFRLWSASHKFPVSFLASVDKEQTLRGKCYWSVTVYADRPERAEYWHGFYVSRETNIVSFVDDITGGSPIPLTAWRKSKTAP